MVVRQGDLVWVSFPPIRGSEPAGRRPAVVIQSDVFNRSKINTVVVAAITSQLKLGAMPGNVRLLKGEAGIAKASVINISQIHSIDRSFIEAKIGTLSQQKWGLVQAGIQIIFNV